LGTTPSGGIMGKELLLEIGAEEIPAGFIPKALEEMALAIGKELRASRIAHGEVRTLGTPRRLVLLVRKIVEKQEDVETEKLGPPLHMAFGDKGKPTKAAMGFAKGQGLRVEDLKVVQRGTKGRSTGKGGIPLCRKKGGGEGILIPSGRNTTKGNRLHLLSQIDAMGHR